MKTAQFILITLLSTLSLSCQEYKVNNTPGIDNAPSLISSNAMKAHHFRDAHTGMIVKSQKFPADWQVVSRASYNYDKAIPAFSYQIQGSGGLKAFNSLHEAYTFNEFPENNQMMAAYGIKIKRVPAINELMQQEFAPKIKSLGFSYLGQEQATDMEQILNEKIRTQGLNNVEFKILSTKWANGQGQQALVNLVLMQIHNSMPGMGRSIIWTYGVDYLIAGPEQLQTAYEAMKIALRSEVENPQWLQYKNNLTIQRQRESNQAHQQRMKTQQDQFQSHQQYMKGVYADSDARHNQYMNNLRGTNGSDAGHQNYINMIRDEETVYDANGQSYQVDGYAKQYWTDSDGNYIKSDDLFYNPNGDINLNNKEWNSMEKKN